jgi:diaminopimelate epimerase
VNPSSIPFVKMHGCGNDYVFVDDGFSGASLPVPRERWPAMAHAVSERHTGVGGDGLIVLRRGAEGPLAMVMFNADGSEGALCLNGLRCAAKYARDRDPGVPERFAVETISGPRPVRVTATGRPEISTVTVEVGTATFARAAIPAAGEGAELWGEPLGAGGETRPAYGVSLGNPHVVLFEENPAALAASPLDRLGPALQASAVFPEGVNVHLAAVTEDGVLVVRHWERGSGPTLACGSGAVAVFAVARRLGRAPGEATVAMPGGEVTVADSGGVLLLTGPAVEVCSGEWLWGGAGGPG